ncbi:MAG TPA: cytochrome c-type biogenesis protein CcmH [Candidatus Binatia bacterium]|nr:cytochrome c-type biogenesis protein CcmH [Candidatus Binatia bacterium]
MRRLGAHWLLLLLLAVAVPVLGATQHEVEEALTCQCGCGLTVHSCNHLNCGSGEPMKKEIAERLARGESKDIILAAFSSKYGEKVLSSPTFSGFNWFAWVTPFAAVLIGASILTLAIRRKVRAPASAPVAPSVTPTGDTERRERLRRELDDDDRE